MVDWDDRVSVTIRLATSADLPDILELLARCLASMRADGIDQWDQVYPSERVLSNDIAAGSMYVASTDLKRVAGVIALNSFQDPEYAGVPWKFGGRIGVVHRLMIDPELQGAGIARSMMLLVEEQARQIGYESLRLDAFTLNPRALRLYQGLGYRDAGPMTLRKGVFRGFEKTLA